MVGQTPRAQKSHKQRMEIIAKHGGCLPCLLVGYLDVHTTIEHVTNRGRRLGKGAEQHFGTIGLCVYHHFGHHFALPSVKKPSRQQLMGELGPSLAFGRTVFEEFFGDEVTVLLPCQDYLLERFEARPWPEYNVDRHVAADVRRFWIAKNATNLSSQDQSG